MACSFFIDLHTTATTCSKFGSFILQASKYYYLNSGESSTVSEFIMLSSEYEYGSSEYGDWYWGTRDGTWHNKCNAGGVWHRDDTSCGWYCVSDEVFKVDDDDDDDQLVVLKLDYLGELLRSSPIVVGSCNGLICLHDLCSRTVSLWNPATRQFRILPNSITIQEKEIGIFPNDFVAFGFDVKTKDYKVVQISFFARTSTIAQLQWHGPECECICRVQVYSLSTDSWRILEGINSLPGQPIHGHQGLYLNGHCFFMACEAHVNGLFEPHVNGSLFIISFDFTKEIFSTMQFPDHGHRHHLSLCCLGGEKMALFTTLQKMSSGYDYDGGYEDDYDGYEDCDIWVFNEQGCNNDSWTKLHSFQIKNTGGLFNSTQLRGLSNNGKFALLETLDSGGLYRRMQLYNLVTKEAKMDFQICNPLATVNVYKPSLVSIVGGNGTAAAPSNRVIGGAM